MARWHRGLTVALELGGTAREGVHILEVPDSITIPAGRSSGEIVITALAEGIAIGAKVVLFQLGSREIYQLGNPHEALLYAAATEAEANGAGTGDSLALFIDGVKQSETTGAIVRVQRDLTGSDAHLLMWEFKRGSGNAVIRNLAP